MQRLFQLMLILQLIDSRTCSKVTVANTKEELRT